MLKVILKQDIQRIGKAGQVIVVKDGFARNYLFPNSLAVLATPDKLAQMEKEKKIKEQKKEAAKKQAEIQAKRLQNYSCTIAVEANDENLYGSISSQDIANALSDENIIVDENSIVLSQPIKKLGIYEVNLNLHPEVTATIKVWIVKK